MQSVERFASPIQSRVRRRARRRHKNERESDSESETDSESENEADTEAGHNERLATINAFAKDLHNKRNDPIIQRYLQILGVDASILHDTSHASYDSEFNLLVDKLLVHESISHVMYNYCQQPNHKSKLDFLSKFSEEQIAYITSPLVSDSKLIACAGSGKTRSILGRIRFMVEHSLARREEIFAITFSKHASNDFKAKCRSLFTHHGAYCKISNFSTIDSLARSILCKFRKSQTDNVEILSVAFRNFLRNSTEAERLDLLRFKNIKHLFIDEAQDLNEVQYDIALELKAKFGTNIHLIGDPNQNIYQFRRSSSRFLINFSAKSFELTLNFRSTQQIIDFSDYFKTIDVSKSRSATGRTGNKVTICTLTTRLMHIKIVDYLVRYQRAGHDLAEVAIICPTRGVGKVKGAGLSAIANLLSEKDVPFQQLYDEATNNHESRKNVQKVPGQLNLLTYHGTKGLEYNIVFVMDFYQNLHHRPPTKKDHDDRRFWLYVATSRARDRMFVCVYTDLHRGHINDCVSKIPAETYRTIGDINSVSKCKHCTNSGEDDDRSDTITGITELINALSDVELNDINDMGIVELESERNIYASEVKINRGTDEALFGIFCEELLYLQYLLSRKQPVRELDLIQAILTSKRIILVEDKWAYMTLLKKTKIINTWKAFDRCKDTMSDRVQKLFTTYFDRSIEISDCFICDHTFLQIIENNREAIRASYEAYTNPASYNYDYRVILEDFFYVIVVCYAYNINHYYYINNKGIRKQHLLRAGTNLFSKMNQYVLTNYLFSNLQMKVPVRYDNMMLRGEIDFIETHANAGAFIVDIKCVTRVNIKHYIQLLLYNFCYYSNRSYGWADLYSGQFKILNLLTGIEHTFIMRIKPDHMFNILLMLAAHGNLPIRDMNLVFDLKTNGLIENIPIYRAKRTDRSRALENGRCEIYPEIIDIAIRDYDTGLVVFKQLVKPVGKIPAYLQIKTGITRRMLSTMPDINAVRVALQCRLKHLTDYCMMSHDCNSLGRKIICYDKLVPELTRFLDTKSIIPVHMKEELPKKKLNAIYYYIFHCKIKSRRAMSDVNAIIKIMQHLDIGF